MSSEQRLMPQAQSCRWQRAHTVPDRRYFPQQDSQAGSSGTASGHPVGWSARRPRTRESSDADCSCACAVNPMSGTATPCCLLGLQGGVIVSRTISMAMPSAAEGCR
eukprot:5428294-Prymnesium_polylepis.3